VGPGKQITVTEDTKTHIISQKLANYREADRCCPVCDDGTRIKRMQVVNVNEETGNITFGGYYWVCESNPDDTDHYQYSPGGGRRGAKPRESVHAHVPERFKPSFVMQPRGPGHVIKRGKDGKKTVIK
jgi:hypothetical protein